MFSDSTVDLAHLARKIQKTREEEENQRKKEERNEKMEKKDDTNAKEKEGAEKKSVYKANKYNRAREAVQKAVNKKKKEEDNKKDKEEKGEDEVMFGVYDDEEYVAEQVIGNQQ